jgi:caffeic acid 3-O-methyltransferase
LYLERNYKFNSLNFKTHNQREKKESIGENIAREEMASISNSNDIKNNGEEKKLGAEEVVIEEESFSRAMELASSIVLSMTLLSATELGVFQVLAKAGEDSRLSPKDIALRISCQNPKAPGMLDRVLALLASHKIVKCHVISDHENLGSFHRLYSITPVARLFAPNSDGVSLGPLIALFQDQLYLRSW